MTINELLTHPLFKLGAQFGSEYASGWYEREIECLEAEQEEALQDVMHRMDTIHIIELNEAYAAGFDTVLTTLK